MPIKTNLSDIFSDLNSESSVILPKSIKIKNIKHLKNLDTISNTTSSFMPQKGGYSDATSSCMPQKGGNFIDSNKDINQLLSMLSATSDNNYTTNSTDTEQLKNKLFNILQDGGRPRRFSSGLSSMIPDSVRSRFGSPVRKPFGSPVRKPIDPPAPADDAAADAAAAADDAAAAAKEAQTRQEQKQSPIIQAALPSSKSIYSPIDRYTDEFNKSPNFIIHNKNITNDEGIPMAIALGKNTNLLFFELYNCNISIYVVKAIAEALGQNTTLTVLGLQDNNIGDDGAIAIAEALEKNTTLTELNLWGNKIGDDGAIAIAEALKINTTLIFLNVNYNIFGDKGAKAIEKEW